MRLADRYLLRRVLAPLCVVWVVVSVLVSIWQLGRISQMVLMSLHDGALLMRLLMDLWPSFAGMALGASGLFGCLLAYDRLSEDGELTALSAAGVRGVRLLMPAWLLGLGLAGTLLALEVWGAPWGASRYGRDVALLAARSFSRTLKPGVFNEVGNLASVYVAKATEESEGRSRWEGVAIGRDVEHGPTIILSRSAEVAPAGPGLLHLELDQGEALLPPHDADLVERLRFEHATVTVDVASWVESATLSLHAFQSLSWEELLAQAMEPGEEDHQLKLRFYFWQKLAVPLGMPLLCLLGALGGGQRSQDVRGRAYLLGVLAVAAWHPRAATWCWDMPSRRGPAPSCRTSCVCWAWCWPSVCPK